MKSVNHNISPKLLIKAAITARVTGIKQAAHIDIMILYIFLQL